MKHFHCHVYFEPSQFHDMEKISQELCDRVPGLRLAGLVNRPVGPHPLPMIEFHLTEDLVAPLKAALAQEPSISSALIHQDTGDDLFDHTEGAFWYGEKLTLDFDFFELVKRDPSQKVHKD